MPGYRILIAGAGIGGLSAASCLMKAGHHVQIFEQAPALAEVGAGIQISANAMHVLRHLGLGEAITRVGVQPGAYVFRLHDTGEVIQRFSLSEEHERLHGAPYTQLHRADLHEILAERARAFSPDVVQLNRKVTGFSESEQGVELHFEDGTSARGDLLLGADGLKSAVRRQIAGDAPATYTGDAAWRITVPTERLPAGLLERVMSVFLGPGGHVVCYYLRGGALLNFVGLVETDDVSDESWTVKTSWDALKAHFAGWHPMLQTVIDAADKDQCYLLVAAQPAADSQLEHCARDAARRCRASDAALSRAGRGDGDRGRRRADAFARDGGYRSRPRCSFISAVASTAPRASCCSPPPTGSCSICGPRPRSGRPSRNATKAPIATTGSIRTIR